MPVADDADALALVERIGEIIDGDAVDPGADQADDDHAERVDGEGRAADQGAGDRNGGADVEMKVFVDDLGEDVQPARGSIDPEEDGLGDTEHQHETDQVQPRVVHDRSPVGDQFFKGKDPGPEIDERTKDQGRINGLRTEFRADQQPGEHQQDGIDGRDDHGDPHRHPELRKDLRKDDREARDAADDQLARHEEIIDGGSPDEHTERHDDQFFPELGGSEGFQKISFHRSSDYSRLR